MMFSGESPRIGLNDIDESIQSLKYDHSNYTAWLRGEPSNFTLYEESDTSILLRQAFLHPPLQSPTAQPAYYNNYTGAYKTKLVRFHNLTHPPNEVSWAPLAADLYREKNLTTVHARAGEWNWTNVLHVSFSLFFYKSTFLPPTSPLFNRFRGYIELEHPNPEKGMTEGPAISLRVEGVHILSNGTLFALVEPKAVPPDIRQLAGIVPIGYRNATAHVVAEQYAERIKELEKAVSNGDTRLEANEESFINCSFSFHGYVEPLHIPQNTVEEYERELKDPSGIPIPKLPRPTFDGILMSEECGIMLEFTKSSGSSSDKIHRRIVLYSAVTSVVFYVLIQLSLQVSDQWRTATSLLRGSRGVMATWLIADSYAALSHLMAAAATTEARYAVLVPGFLGCILLITDLRLLTYLNGVQMLLNQAQTQNQPPQPTTAVVASSSPAETRANNHSTPESTSLGQETPAGSRNPVSIASSVARYLTADDFRVWLTTVAVFSVVCLIFFRLPVYGIWFILVSSTWSAQVTRNIYQQTRRVLQHHTILISSVVRLFTPLYLFACPDNLIGIEPAGWVFILPVWVGLQACVLIGQDYFGPTWFIPSLWHKEVSYDYHPDLAKSDEESVEATLGDCSICMERISTDEGELSRDHSSILGVCWKEMSKKRRAYALAPCGHNFHTKCLEQWLDIKSICPQCRRPLPPL
ncbi:hypothetical protein CPB86DRAFT_777980 [Serendipita vermifera]|nr:hypothetical protein CPB86DRAFT_777980 [Serendipita vermifera]